MTVTAAAPRTHGLHAPLLATSVSALGAGASTAYLASRIAGPQLGHLNIGIIAAMTAGIAGIAAGALLVALPAFVGAALNQH